ncbi:hypothetical protein DFH08DRAFT_825335 [Mycena albidolilacea]|uniref:Uncharacterized protein n=1 Tax=Mycena albidolilacea TaxID=1033008 RepID=A0AAD6Z2A9_9AGAR|nr:hypothetical protein DFH08DRAFT_825335 [Mycena albidolilacea]
MGEMTLGSLKDEHKNENLELNDADVTGTPPHVPSVNIKYMQLSFEPVGKLQLTCGTHAKRGKFRTSYFSQVTFYGLHTIVRIASAGLEPNTTRDVNNLRYMKLVLRRALDFKLAVDNYIAKNKDLRALELSKEDWEAIELVAQRLEAFRTATTQMSVTKSPMISMTHAVFRGPQEELRKLFGTLPDNVAPQLKQGIISAHTKLSDYYTKFDESPLYTWPGIHSHSRTHKHCRSAVAVGRIFSGGRDTIFLRRASLKAKTISTLMFVKNQLRMQRNTLNVELGEE